MHNTPETEARMSKQRYSGMKIGDVEEAEPFTDQWLKVGTRSYLRVPAPSTSAVIEPEQ
jgi:hypothetical protein